METVSRLQLEIRTNGSVYKMVRRSENVALYKQFIDNEHVGWEFGLIRVRESENIKGKQYGRREVYFKNDDFGVTAWSPSRFVSEEEVIKKFEEYDKYVNNRNSSDTRSK